MRKYENNKIQSEKFKKNRKIDDGYLSCFIFFVDIFCSWATDKILWKIKMNLSNILFNISIIKNDLCRGKFLPLRQKLMPLNRNIKTLQYNYFFPLRILMDSIMKYENEMTNLPGLINMSLVHAILKSIQKTKRKTLFCRY